MKLKNQFHLYAGITILFWSLAYVLTRLTLPYFTAYSLGFLRYFAASCTLIIVAAAVKMKPPCKADIPWFLGAGAIGFFLYIIAFHKGQATVTASTGSVVIATVPVITALLARIVYQEKLRVFQWTAIGIEFFGVIILTLMNDIFSVNNGLFWLFLAAFALSIYNLIQRKLTQKYTGLQTAAFSIFFGTVMLSGFLPASIKEINHAPGIQWIYILILGIFSSAAAYVSWSKALAIADQISQVSNYMFITPFLTIILGIIIAHEVPDQATVAGGAIILFGVFIFNFGGIIYRWLYKLFAS